MAKPWRDIKRKSKKFDKSNRFQYQSFWVKLWRRRWLLLVPYRAISLWNRCIKAGDDELGEYTWWALTTCWSIEHGMAHFHMLWLHDWDEVDKRICAELAKQDDVE